MTKGYEYDESEMEKAVEKSRARRSKEGSRGKFFNLQENMDNIFRFLPPPAGSERRLPFLETTKHFMQNEGKYLVLNCTLEKHGVCPICSHVKSLRDKARNLSSEEAKKKMRKAASDIRCQYAYVYTVLNEENEIGTLEMPSKLHDMILEQCSSLKKIGGDNFVNVYDFEKGRNIIITKKKEFKSNSTNYMWVYSATFFPTESAIPKGLLDDYEGMYVFPEIYVKDYDPENLEAALRGDFSFLQKKKSDVEDSDPTKIKDDDEVDTKEDGKVEGSDDKGDSQPSTETTSDDDDLIDELLK